MIPAQDGGVEYVTASIDLIGDELLGLLHKATIATVDEIQHITVY